MKSLTPRWGAGVLLALAALAPASGQTLVATPSTIQLTCNTNTTGPGPAQTVTVRPVTSLTGSNTITVGTAAVGAGLVITAPSSAVLNTANQAAGIVFSVRIASGCAGAATATRTFRFTNGGTNDVTVSAALTITAGATSPLVTAPSAVNLVCVRTPGSPATYTPGAPVTMAVTSATTGGTPFTVDDSTSWLEVTPTSATGTATATNLTFSVATGCGSFAAGTTNTATVRLQAAPAPDRVINVSLQVVPPTPLTSTPGTGVISYVKNSGVPGRLDVLIGSASSPPPFMTVDTASMPAWLTVDTLTGLVPRTIRFSSTAAADAMVPGTYTATVRIRVSNFADLQIPITLQLNNPPPRLSVSDGLTRNLTWTVGTPLPTPSITLVSSDSPISYSIETGGGLAPIVASTNLRGLAYSFGTIIPVTFNPNIFAAAQPGTTLTGTIAITSGNPATTLTVTMNVAVQAPGATITSITPASLPTANPGQTFTLSVSGTAFVPSPDLAFRTRVGIITASGLMTDPSIAVNVVNVSNMILTITVPSVPNPNLPFAPSGTGGTVMLGVCNPSGTTCSTPTGTVTFTIGSNPIIDAVTSASSFRQVTAPQVQTVAPYDVLSIFGGNFCSSGGRGCSSSEVLFGALDPLTFAYPRWVSPDPAGPTRRELSVVFQTRATPPVELGRGSILFATNNQINVLVPAGVNTAAGQDIDLVVRFGFGSGATMLTSAPYRMSAVATNPGLFTVAANGMGDGAILNSNFALINSTNEAGMRSTASDSDTVQIYLTGLGIPNSTADNASAGTGFQWSGDCITLASYLTSLSNFAGTTVSSADGLVISSSLINSNRLLPCFVSGNAPTVSVGGVAATVTYAGLVADSFVGLYQVNARLPGSGGGPFTLADGSTLNAVTTPVQLPVQVSYGGRSSQPGVTMWVRRRLRVTPPSGAGLTGAVGALWSSSNNAVTAAQGTAPYRYAVTSGLLPSGLSLNASTGAISGVPAANTSGTYQVTVTASDSANVPITGTVSFTLTVTGGLFVTSSGTAPYLGTNGTADATLTTVTATGGVFPYSYAITSPSPIPAGITINASTGVISLANNVAAGRYQISVTATDATSGTPLTGTVNFEINVALNVTRTNPVAGTAGSATATVTTVSAAGGTGAITYALDSVSAARGWITIDANTGVVGITNASVAGTYPVTVTATAASAATGASHAGTGSVTFNIVVN